MKSVADITQVLSSGSVTGATNSLAVYGLENVDEEELMRELDELGQDDGSTSISVGAAAGHDARQQVLLPSCKADDGAPSEAPAARASSSVAITTEAASAMEPPMPA